jgi:hypothetical protein
MAENKKAHHGHGQEQLVHGRALLRCAMGLSWGSLGYTPEISLTPHLHRAKQGGLGQAHLLL